MGREGLRRNPASHCWVMGQEHEGETELVMLAGWKTWGKVVTFPSWQLHFSAMLLKTGAQLAFLGVSVHFSSCTHSKSKPAERGMLCHLGKVCKICPLCLWCMFPGGNQNQKHFSTKECNYIYTSIYLISIFILVGWHLFIFVLASFDLELKYLL